MRLSFAVLTALLAVSLFGCESTSELTTAPPAQYVKVKPAPGDYAYQAPARTALGPQDVDVFSNGYQIVGGSFVNTTTGYPLIEAILAGEAIYASKQATVVFEVHGVIPSGLDMQLGGGDAGLKSYRAYWPGTPMDIAIRGASGPAADQIGSLSIRRNLSSGASTPGIKFIRIENVEIVRRGPGNFGLLTPGGTGEPTWEGGGYVHIEVYDCNFAIGANQPKWGARFSGRCSWDFRGNHFEFMKEHSLYADSPQGDSIFKDNTTDGSGVAGQNGATMLHVVNRTDNIGYSGVSVSGYGYLLVQDNVATNIDVPGGSDFTVAGHQGVVIFRGNSSIESGGVSNGSIAVWDDVPRTHHDANGYATRKVIIQNHTVNMPNGNRGHVMLEGIKTLEVRDGFTIAGNQAAFILDHTGNAQPNGNECFMLSQPLSQYAGFQAAVKVRRGTTTLTNTQVDALWCPISL